MLGLRNVRGTLEHQVLKEVRKSGPTYPFVFGANVIPDVDGGGWCCAINDGDQAQTVRKPPLFQRDGMRC